VIKKDVGGYSIAKTAKAVSDSGDGSDGGGCG